MLAIHLERGLIDDRANSLCLELRPLRVVCLCARLGDFLTDLTERCVFSGPKRFDDQLLHPSVSLLALRRSTLLRSDGLLLRQFKWKSDGVGWAVSCQWRFPALPGV